jgi:starch synthase
MKVLLLHPGTQHAPRLACQLNRLDVLDSFVTGIGYSTLNPFIKILPHSAKKRILSRLIDCGIQSSKIKRIPLPEIRALYRLSRGGNPVDVMHLRNKRFQEAVADKWLTAADAIIGFDTSSWLICRRAQQTGRPYFLDQSTIHAKEKIAVVEMLRKQYPAWFIELPNKSSSQLETEDEEHRISNRVVVASTFAKNSLLKNGVPDNKISINPYGVSNAFFLNKPVRTGKLRFLYVGLIGPAKGVPFLLDVWNEFEFHKNAELWLIGSAPEFFKATVQHMQGVSFKGWVAYRDLPATVAQCDVLVFPSFYDGFGQVILEAMAAGIPVITTEATAGPDIIEHDKDGWLMKSGDKSDLATCMRQFVGNRALANHAGTLAREKAKSFSWEAYGDRWKKILQL